jgi:hypothetical protein
MNYQGIRAAYEAPIATACAALSPAVPVFFDNLSKSSLLSTSEYVLVNITFGLTTEIALKADFDYVRGAIVCRIHTPKGKGSTRNQTIIEAITGAFQTLNATPRAAGAGVYARVGQITGPTFDSPADFPHYIGRISCGFIATVYS